MSRHLLSLLCACGLLVVAVRAEPRVAIIADAPWSPGDAPRDGAAELGVLLRLAELLQHQPDVGLVGIGDRRGIFQEGTRRGLEFAVRQGVPVVRLAHRSAPPPSSGNDWFIDGGVLSPEAASALLTECLARYGAPPKFRTSQEPTPAELHAFRQKLQLYQAQFAARQSTAVAMR